MNPDNYAVVALFAGWLSSKQVRGFGLTSIYHITYLLTLYFVKANSKLLTGLEVFGHWMLIAVN